MPTNPALCGGKMVVMLKKRLTDVAKMRMFLIRVTGRRDGELPGDEREENGNGNRP